MNDISPRELIRGFTDLGGNYENASIAVSVNRNVATTVASEFITRIYHCHPYYEFFFIRSGSTTLSPKDGAAQITLDVGDICIVPPFLEHYTVSQIPEAEGAKTPFIVGFSFFDNHLSSAKDIYKALRTFLGTTSAPTVIRANSYDKSTLSLLLADFDDCLGKEHLQSAFLDFCRLLTLLIETRPAERRPLSKSDIISKIDNFVSCFYMYDIKLTDLAECFYISEHSLNRLIYEYYHDTFHSLLTKRRMLIAATYLVNSDDAVSIIAERAGYTSPSNFYTAFKRYYGMLPSDYRKQQRTQKQAE